MKPKFAKTFFEWAAWEYGIRIRWRQVIISVGRYQFMMTFVDKQ
jgi:hypothetical protein